MSDNKADFYIEKVDEYTMKLYCDDEGTMRHAYDFFKYTSPQFQQQSRYGKSRWDGTIRLLELRTGKMPMGLLQILLAFCKEQRYTFDIDQRITDKAVTKVTMEELKSWVAELDLTVPGENFYSDSSDFDRISPYYYQMDALYLAIRYNRFTVLAATGAGKSLIAYMLIRYYEMMDTGKKTLVIVPSAKLVNQLAEDFSDYSIANGWAAAQNIHRIVDGGIKTSNKPIFISTWQALQDEDEEYFDQFDKLVVDECHLSGADKLTRIAKCCNKAHQRVGMTATLKDSEMHQMQVQANFGPVKRVVSTKELQELGQACDSMIHVMNLNYSVDDRKFAAKKFAGNYQHEIDWLINHPYRNKIIKAMALSMKGNSLFLFNRNEAHLEVIYNELKTMKENVYMINGDVALKDREVIERLCENGTNVTVLASYGTMSTGVSIKNLHNLVLCHPSKSLVRVLQSIGRLLRTHSSKTQAQIYDLVDNLKMGSDYTNYGLTHAVDRFGYYTREQHKTQIKAQPIKETFLTWKAPKPKGNKKK